MDIIRNSHNIMHSDNVIMDFEIWRTPASQINFMFPVMMSFYRDSEVVFVSHCEILQIYFNQLLRYICISGLAKQTSCIQVKMDILNKFCDNVNN